MNIFDIITKKKHGEELSDEEISYFVRGYTNGDIPDYQISALLMAICLKGMSDGETLALTEAIRSSGETVDLSEFGRLSADKHSTGGVGDKTTLIAAPLAATLGCKVAKMSGRGLGHTGGTVDKLEAFRGFRTDLSMREFEETVDRVGISIIGQTAHLAPADKLLYALRDVTATVDSIPLIASSIMGKKLAADDDCIVLDVKTGSGAFMKDVGESRELAALMVEIGRRAGKSMCALITDMDRPLGNTIGNSLEVIEAIETLRGQGPCDLTELCVALAVQMLVLAGKGTADALRGEVMRVIESGAALGKLAAMVEAQGGDPAWVYDTSLFPTAPCTKTVVAPSDGFITQVDAEGYGVAALLLGAGRNTKEDVIDMAAGIRLHAKTGDAVHAGDPIATLYTSDPARIASAERALLDSTLIASEAPAARPLIFDVIT